MTFPKPWNENAITVSIPKKLTAYDKAHANPPWYEKAAKFQHKMRW